MLWLCLSPAGQRDAAQREEADGPGGVCQGPGVPGSLARHLQPGGHATHQRARLRQLPRK